MPQPLKQSLDQSKWLQVAEQKLRELENLVDLNLEEEKLKPQLSMGEDVQSPEKGVPLHPNVRAPLSRVLQGVQEDPPRLGDKSPASHKLGKLSGLYQMKGCEFNPEWKVPDITQTQFDLDIINECPSRNWKYLTPAKFWPKSISYYPREIGVKPKYPDNQKQHEAIVGIYLNKLYEAGILYKRNSKHIVTFKGKPYPWETKYLVIQRQQYGPKSSKINGHSSSGRRGIIDPSNISATDKANSSSNSQWSVSINRTCYGTCAGSGRVKYFTQTRTLSGRNRACLGSAQSQATISTSRDLDTGRRQTGLGNLRQIPGRTRGRTKGVREETRSHQASTTTTKTTTRPCVESDRERDSFCRVEYLVAAGSTSNQGAKGSQEEDVYYLRGNTTWPNRITGRIFFFDKNSRNTEEARLVVVFSQFSKGQNALRFPKYWSPNLSTLRRILPVGMHRISLDLSQAFYHIPLNPASGSRLAISDGESVYYFRKTPMGVGISPFFLHLFSAAIGSEISRRFNIWTFTYMDDFLLCHPNARHLNAVSHAVCTFLQEFGIRINFDKMTPSPVTTIRFLGYEINEQYIQIEDSRWTELRTVIKKISVGKWYDWKCIQRLIGHIQFVLPFTKGNSEMLKPMYLAVKEQVNFSFSSRYRNLLYKLTMGVCRLTLNPKVSLPLPRVATDATLTHGAISHITGGSAVFTFSKVRDIHVQELLMSCLAMLMIKPRCLLSDSTFVCHKRYMTLPWNFAVLSKQLLGKVPIYYVPSKYNPADGPTRKKPPDWTALTYTPLSKTPYIPHRLCGG
uniref:Protein P n=1 Tax=Parrot hepatitis B virus TaxID=1128118 RepID=M1G277_9HEPA|nr:polymerase [Parrot hepatitis B virus]